MVHLLSFVALLSAAPLPPGQDSAATLAAARGAQRQFEETRRRNLPREPYQVVHCDWAAGAYCFWYDARAAMPSEPPTVADARRTLLAHLDAAAARYPGDEWLAGQRVRYRLDAGTDSAADDAARACRSTTWWCDALVGLTAHELADYPRAEAAFARALGGMPGELRCRWTDLSRYLERVSQPAGRCAPGAPEDSIARRFWRLARPLLMTRGNDAWTEHLARHVMARLEQQARGPHGTQWGDDAEELLLRFGWARWWTYRRLGASAAGRTYQIAGHERGPSWYFHPAERLLVADTVRATSADWELHRPTPPARQATPYAIAFHVIDAQVQLFRRGTEVLVAAAFDATDDSILARDAGIGALVLERSSREPLHVANRDLDSPRDSWAVRVPWRPTLVGVEIVTTTRRALRARLSPPAPTRYDDAVSGLLFLGARPPAEALAEEVVALALPHEHVVQGEPLFVFWEMYAWEGELRPVQLSLLVERVDAGWLSRMASRARLSRRAQPIRVRWSEVLRRGDGATSRAVRLNLEQQPPGAYRMTLRIEGGGRTAVRERLVEVRRPATFR